MLHIKFNPDIQQIVKYDPEIGLTPNDPVATQAEIKQWAKENPMPLDEPKKTDPIPKNILMD